MTRNYNFDIQNELKEPKDHTLQSDKERYVDRMELTLRSFRINFIDEQKGRLYLIETTFLDKPRFDVVIKEKLREGHKLLGQVLVSEVHSGTYDAGAMSAYGICNMLHTDGVDMLAVSSI